MDGQKGLSDNPGCSVRFGESSSSSLWISSGEFCVCAACGAVRWDSLLVKSLGCEEKEIEVTLEISREKNQEVN